VTHLIVVDLKVTEYVDGDDCASLAVRQTIDADFVLAAVRLFAALPGGTQVLHTESPSDEGQVSVEVGAARVGSSPDAPSDEAPGLAGVRAERGTEGDAGNPSAPLRHHRSNRKSWPLLALEVAAVVAADPYGEPNKAVVQHFGVSSRTASRWIANAQSHQGGSE
jgi:hypothetical protein